jgi:hypothetical protein
VCKSLHGEDRLIDSPLGLLYGRQHSRAEAARLSISPEISSYFAANKRLRLNRFAENRLEIHAQN